MRGRCSAVSAVKRHCPWTLVGKKGADGVVDTGRTDSHVVEYVPFGKHRVSNLAFDGNGSMYVTGEGHLWRLRLSAGVMVVNDTLVRTVTGRAAETPFLIATGPKDAYKVQR